MFILFEKDSQQVYEMNCQPLEMVGLKRWLRLLALAGDEAVLYDRETNHQFV